MANSASIAGKLETDINGTGQLILNGNLVGRIGGYVTNGWFTAYDGNTNYTVAITYDDVNNETIVKARLPMLTRPRLASQTMEL